MAAVLTFGATLPVVKVGRIAGQYVKPRSSATEEVDGRALTSFLGRHRQLRGAAGGCPPAGSGADAPGLLPVGRDPQPAPRFTKGGFADLTRVHLWNQEFVATSSQGQRYEVIASEIERALRFMEACGIDLSRAPQLHQVDVWTSHEGLLLEYEEALTRRDSTTGDWYDCSAHMLWVGERTRDPDGAHVEFFAGVHNPIGVKLGPTTTPDEALRLCERLNPERLPGRLTLIARLGAARVREVLPPLIAAIRDAGHPVVWVCDPMHGNLRRLPDGRKTRHFDDVMAELEGFFASPVAAGTWPGGVHLEFTGEDVTECLGGGEEVLESQLDSRYETLCDPRLNARQSLDLAFGIAELMRA